MIDVNKIIIIIIVEETVKPVFFQPFIQLSHHSLQVNILLIWSEFRDRHIRSVAVLEQDRENQDGIILGC